MTEQTIRHALFSYGIEIDDPVRHGERMRVEKKAYQGETVDIPFDEDVERGLRFGAFVTAETPAVRDFGGEQAGEITVAGDEAEADAADMSDEELEVWIREDKPTVQETIDASEGRPEQARRLLTAEDKATGGDSRVGVMKGLSAIIESESA